MININIRFQLVAVCIWLLMVIDYNRNKHLKLFSTFCFRALLVNTGLSLIFDIGSVITLQYRNQIPGLNRLVHQFFVASVVAIVYTQFLYIEILSHNQRRLSKKRLLLFIIPLIISLPIIIFGDISFQVTDTIGYSYGVLVFPIFLCALVYLITGFYLTIRPESDFTRYQRGSIQIGLAIWFLTLVVQFAFKSLLLSGTGAVLMTMSVYFSLENQKENYDSQTNSFNRNAFHRMVGEYVARNKHMYMISFTYDNLNQINSIMGHDLGSVGLRKIKALIAGHFQCDIFHSRTNTFSIFTKHYPDEDTLKMVQREIQAIEIKGFKIKYYITIMDLHTYIEKEDDVYEYLNFLMMELSERKEKSGVYSLSWDIVNRKKNYDDVEKIIARAIDEKGFEMYYQPIFSTVHQEFHSAEALIRFKRNERDEYVSPEDFIPIAEKQGMIMALGDMVFDMTARDIHQENMAKLGIKFIEVNLSRVQTVSSDIANHLQKIISKYQVSPDFINVEITETAGIYSMESMYHNIRQLQNAGFSLSMDDFGTGFANMDQLNEVKYQVIKLDKSIIWPAFDHKSDVEVRKTAENILSSAINMLKSMKVLIVAEGIETKEMADYLTEHGVDYLQGYYYSRPLSKNDFIAFIKAHKRETKLE